MELDKAWGKSHLQCHVAMIMNYRPHILQFAMFHLLKWGLDMWLYQEASHTPKDIRATPYPFNPTRAQLSSKRPKNPSNDGSANPFVSDPPHRHRRRELPMHRPHGADAREQRTGRGTDRKIGGCAGPSAKGVQMEQKEARMLETSGVLGVSPLASVLMSRP